MARFIFVAIALFCPMALRTAAVQLRSNNVSGARESWLPEALPERSSSRPIMMFAHGCSMTTAGINMVGSLLKEHGITTADTGCGEMMKSLDEYTDKKALKDRMGAFGREDKLIDKVLSYSKDNLTEKFKVVYEWSQAHETTLFWKMEITTAKPHPSLGEFLRQVDTRAFLYLRTNLIDVLHCRVHDFCNHKENLGLGVTVTEGGDQTSCGFRGRDSAIAGASATSAEDTKVKLFPNNVLERLNAAAGGDELHAEYLKQLGFNPKVHSAEDLFAFEYASGTDAPEFQRSFKAWKDLISSLGFTPRESAIKKALLEYGTFTPPKKHWEAIYNFEEIKKILKGTKYYDMLRM